MNSTPMHRVIVGHDWLEVNRVDFDVSAEVATMCCADCCAERQVLHENSRENTHQNQDSLEEAKEALKGITESLNQFTETMNLYVHEMLDGTKYATSEALMDEIAKRSNGDIDGKEIPFRWLKPWMATGIHKAQPKVLLLYKQGPVCNRCDLIFTFDELKVDHIEADKSRGQLTDLQLLCKKCNGEKGNGPPSKSDVSPFKFKGKTCIHRVTCTEVETMQSF